MLTTAVTASSAIQVVVHLQRVLDGEGGDVDHPGIQPRLGDDLDVVVDQVLLGRDQQDVHLALTLARRRGSGSRGSPRSRRTGCTAPPPTGSARRVRHGSSGAGSPSSRSRSDRRPRQRPPCLRILTVVDRLADRVDDARSSSGRRPGTIASAASGAMTEAASSKPLSRPLMIDLDGLHRRAAIRCPGRPRTSSRNWVAEIFIPLMPSGKPRHAACRETRRLDVSVTDLLGLRSTSMAPKTRSLSETLSPEREQDLCASCRAGTGRPASTRSIVRVERPAFRASSALLIMRPSRNSEPCCWPPFPPPRNTAPLKLLVRTGPDLANIGTSALRFGDLSLDVTVRSACWLTFPGRQRRRGAGRQVRRSQRRREFPSAFGSLRPMKRVPDWGSHEPSRRRADPSRGPQMSDRDPDRRSTTTPGCERASRAGADGRRLRGRGRRDAGDSKRSRRSRKTPVDVPS